ncbi:MAG: ATP-binding protein, partial [Oscillochloris sp.]|nr:ATP-binding protein [Oscillochloris sp.]
MIAMPFPRNPYVGPRSFRKDERLYGRERELQTLFYLLSANRIVLLHSPSGAGKTSLIQAQLIDKLESAEFQVLPMMRVGAELLADRQATQADTQPSPNRYILSALQALEEPLSSAQRVAPDKLGYLTFSQYLRQRPGALDEHSREVLIFDQFEEILAIKPNDRPDKERFFSEVGEALRNNRRCALFVIREEYVGALEPYNHFIPGKLDCHLRLDLLNTEAAQTAICEPAREAGVPFTHEATALLVDNLRTIRLQQQDGTITSQLGTYIEPVQLQVVCLQLWNTLAQRPRSDLLDELLARHIAVGDLSVIGDVDHALSSYYEEQIRAIVATGVRERFLRDWFEHWLITSEGMRSQVLRRSHKTEGLPDQALSIMINAHLVREERRLGGRWCELTHDRLIKPIQVSNQAWLANHLHPIQIQATSWLRQGEPESRLLHGDALHDAMSWVKKNAADLTSDEQRFIQASQDKQEEYQRKQRNTRRIRNLSFVVGALGVLSIVLMIFVIQNQQEFINEKRKTDLLRSTLQALQNELNKNYFVIDTAIAHITVHTIDNSNRAFETILVAQHEIQGVNTQIVSLQTSIAQTDVSTTITPTPTTVPPTLTTAPPTPTTAPPTPTTAPPEPATDTAPR